MSVLSFVQLQNAPNHWMFQKHDDGKRVYVLRLYDEKTNDTFFTNSEFKSMFVEIEKELKLSGSIDLYQTIGRNFILVSQTDFKKCYEILQAFSKRGVRTFIDDTSDVSFDANSTINEKVHRQLFNDRVERLSKTLDASTMKDYNLFKVVQQ